MIELTFLKKLMLTKEAHQKSEIGSDICSGCHDAMIMSMKFSDTSNIKDASYYCIVTGISKRKAINLTHISLCVKAMEHCIR